MIPVASLPNIWIADACSALNLAASGHIEGILQAPVNNRSLRYSLADLVIQEAAALRRGKDGLDANERDPIDWNTWIAANIISRESETTSAELAEFVRLTAQIDDGEAMTLALAASRGYGVVTDDRKAQRILAPLPCLDTPTLLKNWAEQTRCESAVLGLALRQIADRARFVPPRHHPLRSWWDEAANIG